MNTQIFTILYNLEEQQYLIGITNDHVPLIASMGINTPRPLPTNIKTTLINMVMELKKMDESPKFVDYNMPSARVSGSILSNSTIINPVDHFDTPNKTLEEAIEKLKKKMVMMQKE